MPIIKYEHFGQMVSVREDLKGKHRDHCLCYKCKKFQPCERDNCKIAQMLYSLCVLANLVTPVWECGDFEEGE